jgi:hypothetical protein
MRRYWLPGSPKHATTPSRGESLDYCIITNLIFMGLSPFTTWPRSLVLDSLAQFRFQDEISPVLMVRMNRVKQQSQRYYPTVKNSADPVRR